MMEILVAWTIGLLTACGIYLTLRGSSFPVVVGLMLLSYAVNLFIVATGRLTVGRPPIPAAGAAARGVPPARPRPAGARLCGSAAAGPRPDRHRDRAGDHRIRDRAGPRGVRAQRRRCGRRPGLAPRGVA